LGRGLEGVAGRVLLAACALRVELCAVLVACTAQVACSGFGGAQDQLPLESTGTGSLGAGAAAGNNAQGNPASRAPSSSSPGPAADWSCLDDPAAVAPAAASTGNVRYSVPVRSLFGLPITNLVTHVCVPADVMCSAPLSEVRGLDAEGLLIVNVPVAFNGYFELLADNHLPSVFYMRKPIMRDTIDTSPVLAVPTAGVAQIAALVNVEVVSDFGILVATALDCRGERAPGVELSNNLGGRIFYVIDGLPNASASGTDSQGLGGFVNVPPRLVELSAAVAADGRLIGTRTLLPRPGWIVGGTLRPPALPLD